MSRYIALLALLVSLLVPATAYAEDAEWRSDPPKQGLAGFSLCTGEASAEGHHYKNVNYIDNEIIGNCDRYAKHDVALWFLYRHGITIDPASVKVTVSRP